VAEGGDDTVGDLEPVGGVGACKCDRDGTGGEGGFDAGGGVLDDGAASRGQAEALGGEQEDLGIGLAAGDFVGGDADLEAVGDAHAFKDEIDVGGGAGRADRELEAFGVGGVDELDGAVHDGQVVADEVAVDLLLASVEAGDGRSVRDAEESLDDVRIAAAERFEEGVLGKGRTDFLAESLPAFEVRTGGVDQHSVHVENQAVLHVHSPPEFAGLRVSFGRSGSDTRVPRRMQGRGAYGLSAV
jgi:hypothetical protein